MGGEIYMNDIRCQLFTVSTNDFVQPVFTKNFVNGVKTLYEAAKNPQSDESKRKTASFIKEFGTDYMETTFFGATLSLESRWASRAESESKRYERQSCFSKSVSNQFSEGSGFLDFLFGGKQTKEVKNDLKKCKEDSVNKEYFSKNEMRETNIVARGATFYTDPVKWAESAQENPVPIDFKLKSISNIFRSGWVDSIEYKKEKYIDGQILADYFDEIIAIDEYCKIVLDLENGCPPIKGCGINGICPFGKICVDNDSELGYTCTEGIFILNFFTGVSGAIISEVHEGVTYMINNLEAESGENYTIYGNTIKAHYFKTNGGDKECNFHIRTPGEYNVYENCKIVETTFTERVPAIKIESLLDAGNVTCDMQGSKHNNQISFNASLTLQVAQQYNIVADILDLNCTTETVFTAVCNNTIENPGKYGVETYGDGEFCNIYHLVY